MKNKKRNIVIFSCLGIIIVILIVIIVLKLTGNILNSEQKELKSFRTNTSISSKNVESYRAKVSIKKSGKEKLNINYIVYNSGNSSYDIILFDEKMETKEIKVNSEKDKKKLEIDYTNTDIFLEGLEKGENIKTTKETIGEEKYTIYDFDISKRVLSNIIKPFKISIDTDGTGKAYVDSNDRVYLIIYNTDDISLSVSYTRIEEKK